MYIAGSIHKAKIAYKNTETKPESVITGRCRRPTPYSYSGSTERDFIITTSETAMSSNRCVVPHGHRVSANVHSSKLGWVCARATQPLQTHACLRRVPQSTRDGYRYAAGQRHKRQPGAGATFVGSSRGHGNDPEPPAHTVPAVYGQAPSQSQMWAGTSRVTVNRHPRADVPQHAVTVHDMQAPWMMGQQQHSLPMNWTPFPHAVEHPTDKYKEKRDRQILRPAGRLIFESPPNDRPRNPSGQWGNDSVISTRELTCDQVEKYLNRVRDQGATACVSQGEVDSYIDSELGYSDNVLNPPAEGQIGVMNSFSKLGNSQNVESRHEYMKSLHQGAMNNWSPEDRPKMEMDRVLTLLEEALDWLKEREDTPGLWITPPSEPSMEQLQAQWIEGTIGLTPLTSPHAVTATIMRLIEDTRVNDHRGISLLEQVLDEALAGKVANRQWLQAKKKKYVAPKANFSHNKGRLMTADSLLDDAFDEVNDSVINQLLLHWQEVIQSPDNGVMVHDMAYVAALRCDHVETGELMQVTIILMVTHELVLATCNCEMASQLELW